MENKRILDMYGKFTKILLENGMQDRCENVVISPYSVIKLLSVVADAAEGETREEIKKVLCPDQDFDDYCRQIKELQDLLLEDDVLTTADIVSVRQGIFKTIKKDYQNRLRDLFRGEIAIDGRLPKDGNNWTLEDDLSKDSVKFRDPLDEIIMSNVTGFRALWDHKYIESDIGDHAFYNADGTVSNVKMMSSAEQEYIENDLFTGFAKPYKNCDFSFLALLPKDPRRSLAELVSEADIAALYDSRTIEYEVFAKLPEFKLLFKQKLNSLCRQLGIQKAFSQKGDFTPLSDMPLFVRSISHIAEIAVDRKGTKALAVTSAFVGAGSIDIAPIREVVLDHPFIFAIVHHGTGIPVFLGTVNHLESAKSDLTKMEMYYLCEPVLDQIDDMISRAHKDRDFPLDDRVNKLYDQAVTAAYSKEDIIKTRSFEAEIMNCLKSENKTIWNDVNYKEYKLEAIRDVGKLRSVMTDKPHICFEYSPSTSSRGIELISEIRDFFDEKKSLDAFVTGDAAAEKSLEEMILNIREEGHHLLLGVEQDDCAENKEKARIKSVLICIMSKDETDCLFRSVVG